MFERAQPIERGCLALVIGLKVPEKIILKVGDCLGVLDIYPEPVVCWETPGRQWRLVSMPDHKFSGYACWLPEKNLMRIDDPELLEQIENETRAQNPNTEKAE